MKKNLALILLMIMLLSMFSQVSAQVSDIGGHWGAENIRFLLDRGIISGYPDGTFKPDRTITRAEFVKIINQAIDNNKVGNVSFSDVKSGTWYYDEVRKAVGAGYINGFPDNTFRPNGTITRQDASKMVREAFGIEEVKNSTKTFSDHGSIRSDAVCCVNALVSKGYISGHTNGTFDPQGSLTRAQAATMVANTIKGERPSGPVVVVDAGHGGSDPGATGNGLREKDINLSVSLKLENELKKLGYNVVMTRRTDVFIELGNRAPVANNINADIFVSIHANSFHDSTARGIETYSFPGSTQGAVLANSIHNEMIKDNTLFTANRGLKTANFQVLRETNMPAVLLELGFVSNAQDAQILRTRQDDFAKAIAKGIDNYFK